MISNFKFQVSNSPGFTIVEVLVVITILLILVAVSVTSFFSIQKSVDVSGATDEFVGVLKLAQSRAISSDNDSQYGVYVNTTTTPNQYTMFKGSSYMARDTSYDTTYVLPKTLQFSGISLGGGNEITFDRLTGNADETGNISLQNIVDVSQTKTIYITSSGTINVTSASALDTNRVKDSRHVQLDYSRSINTSTESVILYFDNSQTESIPIGQNLVSGQLSWQGMVTVGGVGQTVQITTHRLNSPDTQFSIHRDGRYNTKTLKVSLSGDASGYLVNYLADGLTTTHTSTYVSNFAWQ